MKDLMKVQEKDGIETVNARELHAFLEVGRDFSTWIKQRIEKYQFVRGYDFMEYSPELGTPQRGQPSVEYFISFDMAKELSMVENNDKGRKARKWFIEKEKQATLLSSDPIIGVRIKQLEIEAKLNRVEEQVNYITPLPGFFTVLAYAKTHNLRLNNERAKAIGMQASKLCREYGVETGTVPNAQWGTVKTYPEDILDEVTA